MKKYLSIILMIIVISFFWVRPAVAHTLKIDRSIGVSVHINPDDAPQAGKESSVFVEITDSSSRFNTANPSNCICTLTVQYEGKPLAQLPVVSGGAYAQLRYTFPHAGRYTVLVEGRPNGEGQAFQSFSLSYEYFVKGETSVSETNPLVPYIPYIQSLCGAFIVWIFIAVKR